MRIRPLLAPFLAVQVDRAKVLSNTIKQKRKEKAGKWEVPLPQVSWAWGQGRKGEAWPGGNRVRPRRWDRRVLSSNSWPGICWRGANCEGLRRTNLWRLWRQHMQHGSSAGRHRWGQVARGSAGLTPGRDGDGRAQAFASYAAMRQSGCSSSATCLARKPARLDGQAPVAQRCGCPGPWGGPFDPSTAPGSEHARSRRLWITLLPQHLCTTLAEETNMGHGDSHALRGRMHLARGMRPFSNRPRELPATHSRPSLAMAPPSASCSASHLRTHATPILRCGPSRRMRCSRC